jgi:hypothetical protein
MIETADFVKNVIELLTESDADKPGPAKATGLKISLTQGRAVDNE